MDVMNMVRNEVLSMQDLLWGDEEGLLLKWGYNPFPPSPRVLDCLNGCTADDIGVYPSRKIKQGCLESYARYAGVQPEQVTLVNGCDKAFRLIPEIFIQPDDEMLMFSPSYPLMEEAVQLMGGKTRKIPLGSDYRIDLKRVEQSEVVTERTKLIFIVNPNNPTSNLVVDQNSLDRILRLGKIVVVDEAYLEFGGWSSAAYIDRYPNLIVLRSLSKSLALPGLRVAFVLADSGLTKYFRRLEDNLELFNIPSASLKAATVALEDVVYYRKSWQEVHDYRRQFADQLTVWGVNVLDSRTTFLFVRTPRLKAESLRIALAKDRIVIKNMKLYRDIDEHESMIGLPPRSEYERVVGALKKVIVQGTAAEQELAP